MSSIQRDLWPDDIRSEEVLSPEEILKFQAKQLEERTNGLLAGDVVRHENGDRIVLGFEVVARRADVRARLFEVQHRLEYEYPALIVAPDEKLPEYLRDRVYVGGLSELLLSPGAKIAQAMHGPGEWVENEWIASSPKEFSEKVKAVLARPGVKAVVISLLARSNPPKTNDGGETS